MTINKEIEIIIDWESIMMDIFKLEKLGYTDITMQMQEKEERYINLKNTDSIVQLCEIANESNNKSQCNPLKSECERCGKDFSNDDLDIYNDELLCDNCIDEVKDEQGTPHDF